MNVGLIADDAKKKLMQNCCIAYRGILSRHQLYATGTTGRLIQEAAGLNVHKLLEGHVGISGIRTEKPASVTATRISQRPSEAVISITFRLRRISLLRRSF